MTKNSDNQDVWKFPCHLTFKAMTLAQEEVAERVVSAIQKHRPGDYMPSIKPSRKGNYFSVSVKIYFESKDQVDAVYQDVHQVEGVKLIL